MSEGFEFYLFRFNLSVVATVDELRGNLKTWSVMAIFVSPKIILGLLVTLNLSACVKVSSTEVPNFNTIHAVIEMDVQAGGNSNYLKPGLSISGSGIASFRYKLASTSADCFAGDEYSAPRPASAVIQIDVSSRTNSQIVLCAIGIDSSGNEQSASQASSFVWNKVADPSLVILDTQTTEGSAAVFTLILSAPSAYDTRVSYVTQDAAQGSLFSAISGVDFTPSSGEVFIPKGHLTATISVQSASSMSFAPAKTFGVELFAPTGASLFKSLGLGTLKAPSLSINL